MTLVSRRAFTLVELMVVIGIIVVLIALLLPAIQRVRESANKVTCANNFRTIGQAVTLYLKANGNRFPSGGGDIVDSAFSTPRALSSAGVPLTGGNQGLGWMYQILPYMEYDNLWKLRRVTLTPVPANPYSTAMTDPVGDSEIRQTTIETFFCPSRRPPQIITTVEYGSQAANDYAGNMGAFAMVTEGGIYHEPCTNAEVGSNNIFRNGIFVKSINLATGASATKVIDGTVHVREVTDGLANTLMVAEKRMNNNFIGKQQFGDSAGYCSGFGASTLRNGKLNPAVDFAADNPDTATDRYGSAHPNSMNALFCRWFCQADQL